MRVNLISNHRKNTGLSQDVNIMRGLLTSIYEDDKDFEIKLVQYVMPQCSEADVNIFFEVVNPSLFSYAPKNIWIPNHEWTYKSWVPYLHMMNEIWVKTREAERIFTELTSTHVRYIGWTSLNKEFRSKKNYHKAIVPVGKNIYREVGSIFVAYDMIQQSDLAKYNRLPFLNIVSRLKIEVPEKISNKVSVVESLSDSDYDELLSECGLCICLSRAEGFGHAVNEAMASGCNMIVSSIPPFVEDVIGEANLGVDFVAADSTMENDKCLGNFVLSSIPSLRDILLEFCDLNFCINLG
jgi:glycosyltransferase involved in cell wall biosynthesis